MIVFMHANHITLILLVSDPGGVFTLEWLKVLCNNNFFVTVPEVIAEQVLYRLIIVHRS